VSSQESHARARLLPVLFWVTFWPAAPLAPVAAPASGRGERAHRAVPARLARALVDPAEIVVTKLPHYVLPLYPSIAILIALRCKRRTLSAGAVATAGGAVCRGIAILLPVVVGRWVSSSALPARADRLAVRRGRHGIRFLAWRFYESDGAEKSCCARPAPRSCSRRGARIIAPLLRRCPTRRSPAP